MGVTGWHRLVEAQGWQASANAMVITHPRTGCIVDVEQIAAWFRDGGKPRVAYELAARVEFALTGRQQMPWRAMPETFAERKRREKLEELAFMVPTAGTCREAPPPKVPPEYRRCHPSHVAAMEAKGWERTKAKHGDIGLTGPPFTNQVLVERPFEILAQPKGRKMRKHVIPAPAKRRWYDWLALGMLDPPKAIEALGLKPVPPFAIIALARERPVVVHGAGNVFGICDGVQMSSPPALDIFGCAHVREVDIGYAWIEAPAQTGITKGERHGEESGASGVAGAPAHADAGGGD